jgi:hypothetical protein
MMNAQTEANNLWKNSVHFNLLLQLQPLDTMALINVSKFVSYMPTHLQNYTNVNMKL